MACPNGHKGGIFCCEDHFNQVMTKLLEKYNGQDPREHLLIPVTKDELETYQKMLKKQEDPFWTECRRADGRMEWICPHSVGHGNHIHGCDGCCSRDDYPGKKETSNGKGRLDTASQQGEIR